MVNDVCSSYSEFSMHFLLVKHTLQQGSATTEIASLPMARTSWERTTRCSVVNLPGLNWLKLFLSLKRLKLTKPTKASNGIGRIKLECCLQPTQSHQWRVLTPSCFKASDICFKTVLSSDFRGISRVNRRHFLPGPVHLVWEGDLPKRIPMSSPKIAMHYNPIHVAPLAPWAMLQ